MNDPDARVSKLDVFTVANRRERPVVVRRFVQAVRRVDPASQLRATRAVIRVHMRVDDMGDPHVLAQRRT